MDLPTGIGTATRVVADAASVGSDAGSTRHDHPAHPDPAGYQSERRALQEAWRQRWKQNEHVYYEAANDTELELTVERLKDEFAELREKFEEWQRHVTQSQSEVKHRTKGVFVSVVVLVMAVAILLAVVGLIYRQQQKEWLANEAARQQVQKIEQVKQEFAERFLHQLLANKEITAENARQRALKELPALVKLPLEEIQTLIDRQIPTATPEAPVSPLDRARAALVRGKYDEVFMVADEQRQEGRELAMLEGTAALARFRESPKPEWTARALAAFRRALALSDKESKDWTDAALSSARVLHDLARYLEAEPLLVETQRILEEKHGKESSEVAVVLNNLALLLQATNRLAEAEPLYRRALAIDEQSYGAEHPKVAVSLSNLAQLLQATNRLAEAEPLMRRALAIGEQSYGAEHSTVATRLNNLAQLLQDTNRLAEAEPLLRRALAIFEQSYGADHPNVAVSLSNLAQLLQATNRLAEAEPLMQRSVVIFHEFGRKTGHEHPRMKTGLANYRLILQSMKLPNDELVVRFMDARRTTGPLKPIVPDVERLLGPAKSVADVLAALDRQYKADGKPAIYFLKPDQPIAPHLDELLGPVPKKE